MGRGVWLGLCLVVGLGAGACDDGGGQQPAGDGDAGVDGGDAGLDGGDPGRDAGDGGADAGGDAGADGGDGGDGGDSGPDAGDGDVEDGGCEDPCPFSGGIRWGCAQRFMYGINYAWHHFGGDFGGIAAWGQSGVAGQAEIIRAELAAMRAHGASVIRWWVLPDFRGDGVVFDADGNPSGLGGTLRQDLAAALRLAAEEDVYYMLCLFSFDNFRPDREEYGLWIPGMQPLLVDADRRALLLDNVVRPLVQEVAASPHRRRVIAWDVINEPEWAMAGPSPYGDEDYDPNGELLTVSHQQMETFVAEVIAVLRQESDALVTVGGAAWKWAQAWTRVDLDFYQFHMYAWIHEWYPYDQPPATFGIEDKPVVMGEFPTGALAPGVSYADVVNSWFSNGYAGALSWQYIEASAEQLDAVGDFAAEHPCQTSY